ncbi:flavin reductase family protein [Streptomyces sp. Ru71]|uniref:flavin reductase family protein n=1 Tax=Streptomyces sp. Ru71 TaxID=2080746 RepID=UPI0015E480CF|nr:flavin reductase family protein [Streptomyces sp. Ru71]
MSLAPHHLDTPTDDTRRQFVAAMGNAATGVTVVATDGPAGRLAQTVSAMCSVSADPPSLLVCVNRRSPLVAAVRRNQVFSVNVLSTGQAHVSDTFAGRPAAGEPYDFGCAHWHRLDSGAPGLTGAAAVFDCRLAEARPLGTHVVLVGSVLASRCTDLMPLTYHARSYGAHHPIDPQQGAQPR